MKSGFTRNRIYFGGLAWFNTKLVSAHCSSVGEIVCGLVLIYVLVGFVVKTFSCSAIYSTIVHNIYYIPYEHTIVNSCFRI